MLMKKLLLLSLHISFGTTLEFQKPVAEKMWHESCQAHSLVLNDCNMCRCGPDHRYVCKARVCREVDMFGHFNDAIRDINVGMEGHGAWRSTETACEPGVHYTRHDLLCVCDENGHWPNPVCRDIFRVLHSVQLSKEYVITKRKKCEHTKLYLVDCNICFCSSSGRFDPELCTTTLCSKDDPALNLNDIIKTNEEIEKSPQEVYAECQEGVEYKMGCHTCVCLPNNRLLCNNCTNKIKKNENVKSQCSNRVGKVFKVDCNLCYCDKNDKIYCTVKKCIYGSKKKYIENSFNTRIIPTSKLVSVDTPIDDQECTPGTKYKRDCNKCQCNRLKGDTKAFGCTLKRCQQSNDLMKLLQNDCVETSVYEMNCLICQCTIISGVKWQICQVDSLCNEDKVVNGKRVRELSSLSGYCEPLYVYKNKCNNCKCLSDGKTVMCTSYICNQFNDESVSVELIPIKQKNGEKCPNGHSYKMDCNYCYCLSNGNAICTTVDCSREHEIQ